MGEGRFVVIDGVQVSRERATRLGLLKAEKESEAAPAGHESRARGPRSARQGTTPDATTTTTGK